jgi:hypothetical protein
MADETNKPYLSLQQTIGWARARDLSLVEQASKVRRDRFDVLIARARSRAKAKGRDINAELWKASGWTPSSDKEQGFDVAEAVVRKQRTKSRTIAVVESKDRLPPFPIEDYLTALSRAGRLTSMGRRPAPHEGRYSPLQPADWNDLEIRYRDDIPVAESTLSGEHGKYYYIQILQSDVMREFPAEDDRATRQPTDKEVEDIILALKVTEGKIPSQKKCFIIVGNSFPQVRRDHVTARHREVFPEATQGPR